MEIYYTIYEKGNVSIRLSSDKSYEAIDIGKKQDEGKWFDLAIVKPYLQNTQQFDRMTTEEYLSFLQCNLDTLLEKFENKEYSKTKEELKALQIIRTKQRFPNSQWAQNRKP